MESNPCSEIFLMHDTSLITFSYYVVNCEFNEKITYEGFKQLVSTYNILTQNIGDAINLACIELQEQTSSA